MFIVRSTEVICVWEDIITLVQWYFQLVFWLVSSLGDCPFSRKVVRRGSTVDLLRKNYWFTKSSALRCKV